MGRNRSTRLLVALIAGVTMVIVWMVWNSTILAQGELQISKVAGRTEVPPGEKVVYTIVVTNTSGITLSNVVITDELPYALEFREASPTSALVVEGQLLTWRIDSLPVSSTHKITLTVIVRGDAQGTITNTASVSADGVPPSSDETAISILPEQSALADLHVRVAEISPPTIRPGGKIAIVIGYHNSGPGAAENVRLKVSFDPPDAMVVEGGEERELGTLPPDHEDSLMLQGTVRNQPPPLGQITVTVSLTTTSSLLDAQKLIAIRTVKVQPFISPETPTLAPAASSSPSPTSPPPAPTTMPPPSGGKMDAKKLLLMIGIGALVLALLIVIVFLLFRLFRGRKKPPMTKPTRPIVSAPTMPYLESIGYQGQQQRFPLDKPVIRIGRAEDNDIVITGHFQGWDTVSRVHATIERDGARYIIVDQGSLNGVYVNGRRTGRNLLKDGWKVAVGAVEFTYHQPPTPSQPD